MASIRGMVSYQGQGYLHCDKSGVISGEMCLFATSRRLYLFICSYIHI